MDGPSRFTVQYQSESVREAVVGVGSDGTIDGVREGDRIWVRVPDGQMLSLAISDPSIEVLALLDVFEHQLRGLQPTVTSKVDPVGAVQKLIDDGKAPPLILDDADGNPIYEYRWKIDGVGLVKSWTVRSLKPPTDENPAKEFRYRVLAEPLIEQAALGRQLEAALPLGSYPIGKALAASTYLDPVCGETPPAKAAAWLDCIEREAGEQTIDEWINQRDGVHDMFQPPC